MGTTASVIIIAAYFILLLAVAHITTRNAGSSAFFNGDRNSPWYVVAFGTIGATISGVTFVSVPGEVGVKGWHYLQFLMGNFVGYWVIAFVLLPIYYRLRLVSIYDYLRQRFGTASHKTGALFFMLSQMIGASFRLFLVVGVLQLLVFDALGVPFAVTAAVALAMIWLYMHKGGIKTVIWTDTLQTICILAAVALTAVAIRSSIGAAADMLSAIADHPTCRIFDFDWRSQTNFFKQFVAGIGIVIVMNGLDQNMMQKSLTCRNIGESQKNLCWFSVAFMIANVLFLALGTLLYIYSDSLGLPRPTATDNLFPSLVQGHMPAIVGAIFLLGIISAAYSSADSSITALTTVWCMDIMGLPNGKPVANATRHRTTIAIAAAMYGLVMLFRTINDSSIVSAIFTVAGYTYGPLLGLFAFGIATKRATRERAVAPIAIASPILSFAISHYSEVLFDGYKMGFELLILNGAITFAALFITSKKSTNEC